MKFLIAFLNLLLVVVLLLGACSKSTPTPELSVPASEAEPEPATEPADTGETDESGEPAAMESAPLYVALIWNQHQPIYFKDTETGVYHKPWVRLHAAKDYVDMAAMLEEYLDIQATFNLTPSLLRQLLDLEGGAVDLYWQHTMAPAAELTEDQKAFIISHFFDINPKIIARFPRYQEIVDDRDNNADWDSQTWLDLQVFFNLGWTDPAWLEEAPLSGLVARGRDFVEDDKETVLDVHDRMIAEVIPLHRRLQDEGRIEVTMTPYFHPILPLLVDSELAILAAPDIALPARFTYGSDAVEQITMGVDFYTELFGRPPQGMWPAGGAVAQGMVDMVAQRGIQWMASDEDVLARSLGQTNFLRNSQGVVQDVDALYRPYLVGDQDDQMHIIFRDQAISDNIDFTYSGVPGAVAAQDFIRQLLLIRSELQTSGRTGPHLVSIILDGEHAWEHYPNDGKEFLHNMYQLLQAEQEKGTLQTISPSAFIAQYPAQAKLEELWAGGWASPDYLSWIGEQEENRAWDYLGQVRDFVEREKATLDQETLAQVMDLIYTAEGSDWFWWYGADQNSGDDGSFDLQFRLTLQQVYKLIGEPAPAFLKAPVIPQTTRPPAAFASDLISPAMDGLAAEGEWEAAGYYLVEGDALVSQLWYGFDRENLYLRLDGRRPWADVGEETRLGFYLARPGSEGEQFFSGWRAVPWRSPCPMPILANRMPAILSSCGPSSAREL